MRILGGGRKKMLIACEQLGAKKGLSSLGGIGGVEKEEARQKSSGSVVRRGTNSGRA